MIPDRDPPLWTPPPQRIEASRMHAFMRAAAQQWDRDFPDYAALHLWSVEHPGEFWPTVWDFTGIVAETRGGVMVEDCKRMPGAKWFPGARLNYAENLLRRADDTPALIFRGEDGSRRSLTRRELYRQTARLAAALRDTGVQPGDRVAGILPNIPEAVIAMLAAASLGAVWSSCSPDFGVRGVLDRFGQIEPAVLFAADGYYYNGSWFDSGSLVREVAAALPGLRRTVLAGYHGGGVQVPGDTGGVIDLLEFTASHADGYIEFARLPFDHPLFILYSSGTTGAPKCIVHGAGGTLLQQMKEHQLHCDIQPGDRLFYFTTCGWMMWNWLATGLASGATLLLYDGSPFHPDGKVLFDYADAEGMTHFGTSARFIDAIGKAGLEPARSHRLDALRVILSTGSPLAPAGFDYVYRHVKADVCLASISGGTDILSCFVLGNPLLPVWRGEIQCAGLGMRVDVYDDDGRPVAGRKGELVCTAPFPSMPTGFWKDPGEARYHAAYFEKYPGVWCHGDYIESTMHGGYIIHGRSDAVLNPGGVRIGTAEIYRQVEALPEVAESIVIGQEWDNDVRIVLFVRLRDGLALDDILAARIRERIRANASPRHVPARILQVSDIPRTRSGKIVELAVRDVVHGRAIGNREALANPEALEEFRDRPELAV